MPESSAMLISPAEFREIVSCRQRSAKAAALRGLFRLAEVPYGIAVRWRNRRYDRGRARVQRVDVPVVSVGNITTGGTGKTPMVAWIARWLRDQDIRVALLSRGYGSRRGAVNDEALELEQRLPDVPHLQDPDRAAIARVAIQQFDSQLLLLDDGFQHRRLHRDLDIVLIDALEPFGYGHLLPRGLLREPLSGLRRAHVVALSRADLVSPSQREEIRERVRRHAPEADWIEVAHRPQALRSNSGEQQPLESLNGRRIAAFCGIGNPDGFRRTLKNCGWEVAAFREFPDHHRFDHADIDSLAAWAAASDAQAVVCTHKDLVKITVERLGELPLWALTVGLEVLAGKELLEQRLQSLLSK